VDRHVCVAASVGGAACGTEEPQITEAELREQIADFKRASAKAGADAARQLPEDGEYVDNHDLLDAGGRINDITRGLTVHNERMGRVDALMALSEGVLSTTKTSPDSDGAAVDRGLERVHKALESIDAAPPTG
jgi:hypothetical protein